MTLRDLPAGWASATAGDVTLTVSTVDPRKTPKLEFDYIDISGVHQACGGLDKTTRMLGVDAPVRARQSLRPGDVLVSTVRPNLEKVALVPSDLLNPVASTGFCVLRPATGIEPRYLYYALQRPSIAPELVGKQRGISYPAVTNADVHELQIPIPPPEEQGRIVAALEEHLTGLEAAEAAVGKLMIRLDRLRHAVIAGAVCAFETEQKLLTHGWVKVDLGEVTDSIRNGVFVSRPGSVPNGTPILRIGAVRQLRLDLDDRRWTGLQPADDKLVPFLLRDGDLLFTRYNGNPEYVGACAEVPVLKEALVYPDKLIRVRVDRSRALPAFVALACGVGVARAYIRSQVKTTAGQAGIPASSLRRIPLLIPSLPEQERRVHEAHRDLSIIDEVARSLTSLRRRAGALRRSLLQAAFAGQLVEQDRANEPADLLLKRIAEERAAVAPTARRRRARTVTATGPAATPEESA